MLKSSKASDHSVVHIHAISRQRPSSSAVPPACVTVPAAGQLPPAAAHHCCRCLACAGCVARIRATLPHPTARRQPAAGAWQPLSGQPHHRLWHRLAACRLHACARLPVLPPAPCTGRDGPRHPRLLFAQHSTTPARAKQHVHAPQVAECTHRCDANAHILRPSHLGKFCAQWVAKPLRRWASMSAGWQLPRGASHTRHCSLSCAALRVVVSRGCLGRSGSAGGSATGWAPPPAWPHSSRRLLASLGHLQCRCGWPAQPVYPLASAPASRFLRRSRRLASKFHRLMLDCSWVVNPSCGGANMAPRGVHRGLALRAQRQAGRDAGKG